MFATSVIVIIKPAKSFSRQIPLRGVPFSFCVRHAYYARPRVTRSCWVPRTRYAGRQSAEDYSVRAVPKNAKDRLHRASIVPANQALSGESRESRPIALGAEGELPEVWPHDLTADEFQRQAPIFELSLPRVAWNAGSVAVELNLHSRKSR